MTDAKALPDNLADIEQTDEFKAIDKENTVKQIESKLRSGNVAFLSADNKSGLIWRLMDSQVLKDDLTKEGVVTEPLNANPAHDDTLDADNTKPAAPKKPTTEYVSVENTGAFNILEPATVTIMKAGEVTNIAITPKVGKLQIMRNIEQFNHTRGSILKVLN